MMLLPKLMALDTGKNPSVLRLFHENGEYQATLKSFTAADKKKRTLDMKVYIYTPMQNMDYTDDDVIIEGDGFTLELTVLNQRRKKQPDGGYRHMLDLYGEM